MADTWPSQVYRLVVQEGLPLPEQEVSRKIKEMEFKAHASEELFQATETSLSMIITDDAQGWF